MYIRISKKLSRDDADLLNLVGSVLLEREDCLEFLKYLSQGISFDVRDYLGIFLLSEHDTEGYSEYMSGYPDTGVLFYHGPLGTDCPETIIGNKDFVLWLEVLFQNNKDEEVKTCLKAIRDRYWD